MYGCAGSFIPITAKHLFLYMILFIYLCTAVLGLHCCVGFSLDAVHGFLMAVTFLVVEHGL